MALLRFFFGFWKVSNSVPIRRNCGSRDSNGAEFQLTTTGKVIWKNEKNQSYFPLLDCNIYVVYKSSYVPYWKLKFGTCRGYVVDCEIESIQNPVGFIFNDGWCTYTCVKIGNKYGEYPAEVPFNFLPALQNGYFSDLVIKSSNRKEFKVHRCILKYAAPKLDWLVDPPPLSGYSEDDLRTILHFLYCGCLPKGISEETLNNVISVVSDLPGMEKLISLCSFQKENLAVKRKIIDLVSDVSSCISEMRDIFTKSEEKNKYFYFEFEELYSAVKKSLQEFSVALVKFLVICKTYASAGAKLSQEDDFEILEYVLSKIPVSICHLKEYANYIIDTIKSIQSVPEYWESLMTFLVPRVHDILDTMSSILRKIGECSTIVVSAFQDHFDDSYVNKWSDNLIHSMDSEFDKNSPINTVLFFVKEFKSIVFHFEKEKRRFNRIDLQKKLQLISSALEDFSTEFTTFNGTFTEFTEFLERRVIKGKVFFEMRIVASKVNELMDKIIARRSSLVALLLQLCDLVEKDSFFDCVVSLGFFDPPQNANATENNENTQEKDEFPVVESACKSPPASLSHLSLMGSQLLESRDFSDMVFDVIGSKELERSFTQNESDESNSDLDSDSEARAKTGQDRFEVKAHRTIIGSRCDWFRLALASGMKEDINRKIEIHITPSLFSLFLEFLYTGCLSKSQITFDDFLKLLLLSDRYDFEHLKEVCELNLKNFIDEQNVFAIFNLADQYNANKLKLYCEDFISENPTVVSSELFRELPDNLKREAIICSKGQATKNSILVNILCDESFEEFQESLSMLKKRFPSMEIQASDYERMISALRPKLEKAVVQLQGKIDSEVPRSVLIRTILDAEYDLNRASVLYNLRSQTY